MTPLWILGAYVLASIIMVPVTLLVLATAFVFGPWVGFSYAIMGSVGGAGVTFAIGRVLGRDPVRRIAGDRVNALSRKLGKGGIVAVMVIRMLPVAPFTVVNIVAGATHLRARDFLVGTALGMAPGILAITVFADTLATTIFEPSPANVGILAAVILAIGGVAIAVHRWAIRRGSKAGAADAG